MTGKIRTSMLMLGAVLLMIGIASNASATPVTISLGSPLGLPGLVLFGEDTSQAVISAAINTYFDPIPGAPVPDWVGANWKYTSEPAAIDSGSLATSYNTSFLTGNEGAVVTYVGGNIISPIAYLLAKDGSVPDSDPLTHAWYFYNLTALGWTGTESITITGLWPDAGSFSHISMYGSEGTTQVPEPGTLILLGLGLVGLAGIKRLNKN